MNRENIDELTNEQVERILINAFCSLNGQDLEAIIKWFEMRFETDLPAYRGQKGGYDPLDAMRRNAHREVLLAFVRDYKATHPQENQKRIMI